MDSFVVTNLQPRMSFVNYDSVYNGLYSEDEFKCPRINDKVETLTFYVANILKSKSKHCLMYVCYGIYVLSSLGVG